VRAGGGQRGAGGGIAVAAPPLYGPREPDEEDTLADALFTLHSLLRYLVLLAALGAIILAAAGWRRPGLPPRAERPLAGAFVGLLDLQVVLGVILLTQWPFYGALIGHITMMVLAAAAAHVASLMARRRTTDASASGVRLAGFTLALVLVIGGIMAIQRSVI
jgi:hypothetical protein